MTDANARRAANVRALAARVLHCVLAGRRSLDTCLERNEAGAAAADRPLLRELCYGVLRHYGRLRALLDALLRKPFKAKDRDLDCLLLVGLYQLDALRVPAYAAVKETVDGVQALRKAWAKGVVNGVLRRYQREQATLQAALADAEARAYPAWLLAHLQTDWPADWAAVVAAGQQRPPFSVRVNLRQASRAAYTARLQAAGLAFSLIPHAPSGLTLEQACEVEALPGFDNGAVSVQDGAAQLAAPLLACAPGMRVLDACAAPGGKTAHLLEQTPDLQMVAVDIDAQRLQRVAANLARLQLTAHLQVGDAGQPEAWWDGRPFERILLDAPCSATGVIRRHPDIRWLRNAADIDALVALQARLLARLWPLLAPGGQLLYATCSVLACENQHQVERLLQTHSDAEALPLTVAWGRPAGAGRQVLPGEDGMDGFYYACVRKRS